MDAFPETLPPRMKSLTVAGSRLTPPHGVPRPTSRMDGRSVTGHDTPEEEIVPRHQPEAVLGGSLVRLDDGYLGIPSYSYGGSSQQVVQQVYSNAIHKRYTPTWDGKALDAGLVTRFTDPFRIILACCQADIGPFVAYHAGDGEEYGVIRRDTKQRHPLGNFPPGYFANQPNDGFEAKHRTFWVDGEVGGSATRAYAIFKCRDCGRVYNPRSLAKLGKRLFDDRPSSFTVDPP